MNEDELAAKLLTLARRDLRAAEVLCDQPEVGDGIVGFHAQQAAEKILKAWLTFLRIAYPRTHDLSLLLYKLEEAGAEVANLWELLELNPFAVQFRYDIFDDEPLDHGVTLEQVAALLNRVEGLLADSMSPEVEDEGTPTPG
ncbi:MAG: HEPN domain-containing protein [bacterium]|nr:HEPN domain-containing protein [bacterium]